MKILRILAGCKPLEVVGEGRSLSYRKYPRFFSGVIQDVGNIASSKNAVVILHLQGIAYSQEQTIVQRQACFLEPFRATSPGYPEHFVRLQGFAGFGNQQPFLNLADWRSQMDLHTTIRQGFSENLTHLGVVGR